MGCFCYLLYFVFILPVSPVDCFRHFLEPDNVLQSLGLTIKPDVLKMNVSQEEYSKKMNLYLRRTKRSYEPRQYFTVRPTEEKQTGEKSETMRRLTFQSDWKSVESVTLKLLAIGDEVTSDVDLEIYQEIENSMVLVSRRRLEGGSTPLWIDTHLVHLSDSTPIVVEVQCTGDCRLQEPLLNVVTRPNRVKRHAGYKTDCYATTPSKKRPRCCRHKMEVVFRELQGYEFIVQPYSFDAGYCKGSCPYRYNPANRHASLQSLIWIKNKSAVPKPCCAPQKLHKLEVLHLDETDPTSLKVATWSNMKVIECACF